MFAANLPNQAISRIKYFSHCITVKKALNSPIFPWLLVILWAAAIFLLSNNPVPYSLLLEGFYDWVSEKYMTGILLGLSLAFFVQFICHKPGIYKFILEII